MAEKDEVLESFQRQADINCGHHDLFDKAIERWGETRQIRKLAEECCELAVASHHLSDEHRDPDSEASDLEAFFSEFVDVEIMCAQMRLIASSEQLALLEKIKITKLERLAKRLNYEPATSK